MAASARRVVVWNDTCLGVDAGDDAADWLAAMLGEPLRLVRIDPSVPRLASTQFAGPGPHPVSFADAYPVLMISRESLAELNRRLPAAIPMDALPAERRDRGRRRARRGRDGAASASGPWCCAASSTARAARSRRPTSRRGARDAHQEPLRTLGNLPPRPRAEGRHLRPELRHRGGRRRAPRRRRRPLTID